MKSETMTASDAKNTFGRVLDRIAPGHVVVITRHDRPKAVLLSVDDYESLTGGARRALDALSGTFDALVDRMQTPRARRGMKAAFDAPPKQLGKAAVAAARKRG
jgi:antitoxin Phd